MTAYDEGYQAFYDGFHTNPYPKRDIYDEYEYWIDGWQAAYAIYNTALHAKRSMTQMMKEQFHNLEGKNNG